MDLNTPNKLTVLRMALVPVFLALMLWEFPFHYFVAFVVFALASLTDYWDGKLARRDNLITDFGKFLDPIADKLLTTAAFLGFLKEGIGWGTVWVVFIVLAREFLVSSLRMVSAAKGTVLAADLWGKVKTVVQMIAILVILLSVGVLQLFQVPSGVITVFQLIFTLLLWASAVLTVISGVNYLVQNKDALDWKK